MKKYSILLGVLLILLTLCACSTNFSVTGEWVATTYQLQKPDNTTTPIEQYWNFGEDGKGNADIKAAGCTIFVTGFVKAASKI